MRIFESLADLHGAAGEHLGYSHWHVVDQDRVNTFADATGDHQWIHVDQQAAAHGPYGTTVAHGYLTLSLIPMLAVEVYQVRGVRMGVNYGLNRVRFPAPLPTGGSIRAGIRLVSVDDIPDGAHIVAEVTVEREAGDKPCCVAETVSRYYS